MTTRVRSSIYIARISVCMTIFNWISLFKMPTLCYGHFLCILSASLPYLSLLYLVADILLFMSVVTFFVGFCAVHSFPLSVLFTRILNSIVSMSVPYILTIGRLCHAC